KHGGLMDSASMGITLYPSSRYLSKFNLKDFLPISTERTGLNSWDSYINLSSRSHASTTTETYIQQMMNPVSIQDCLSNSLAAPNVSAFSGTSLSRSGSVITTAGTIESLINKPLGISSHNPLVSGMLNKDMAYEAA